MPDELRELVAAIIAAETRFEDSIAFYLSDEAWDALEHLRSLCERASEELRA